MCPKCNGLLVKIEYPEEGTGVKCMACGRNYYNQEPEAWEPESTHQGMRSFSLGKDVYTTSDEEMRKQ